MDPRLVVAANARNARNNPSYSIMMEPLEEPANLSPNSTMLYDAVENNRHLSSAHEPDIMFFKVGCDLHSCFSGSFSVAQVPFAGWFHSRHPKR